MCHLPSRIKPSPLMEGTSHTTTGLRKAVTTPRSGHRVVYTITEGFTFEEEGPPP